MHRALITPTLCLLLAACGGGGSDSPEPTAVSPSPAAPVAAPAPAPTPPVAAPPASAPPAQTPNPPPAAPAAPQQPIAPSPVPTPNPAPIEAPAPVLSRPAPVAETPTPVPEPVVTVLWCVVQGRFEPVKFTVGPGQPWTTLRAESAGSSQWRSGAAGWSYGPAENWTMLVTDPDGAIAASGDYDIRGDASAYWVGIGWRDAWSSTGTMSAQVRVTGYAFEGGQLIAAEMALPNPRDGSMLCRLDWDALHQQ